MMQLAMLALVRCIVRPFAHRRRAEWFRLAAMLEKAQVDELLAPMDAAGIRSVAAMRKQATTDRLEASLREATSAMEYSKFEKLTARQVQILVHMGLAAKPPDIVVVGTRVDPGTPPENGHSTPGMDAADASNMVEEDQQGLADERAHLVDSARQDLLTLQRTLLELHSADLTGRHRKQAEAGNFCAGQQDPAQAAAEQAVNWTPSVAVTPGSMGASSSHGTSSTSSTAEPPPGPPTAHGIASASPPAAPDLTLTPSAVASRSNRSVEATNRLAAIKARRAAERGSTTDGDGISPRSRAEAGLGVTSPPPSPPSMPAARPSASQRLQTPPIRAITGTGVLLSSPHAKRKQGWRPIVSPSDGTLLKRMQFRPATARLSSDGTPGENPSCTSLALAVLNYLVGEREDLNATPPPTKPLMKRFRNWWKQPCKTSMILMVNLFDTLIAHPEQVEQVFVLPRLSLMLYPLSVPAALD